jgi:hypothetical protein
MSNLHNYSAFFTVHKLLTRVATGPGWLQVAHPLSNNIQKYVQHFSELNLRVTSEPLVATLLNFNPHEKVLRSMKQCCSAKKYKSCPESKDTKVLTM